MAINWKSFDKGGNSGGEAPKSNIDWSFFGKPQPVVEPTNVRTDMLRASRNAPFTPTQSRNPQDVISNVVGQKFVQPSAPFRPETQPIGVTSSELVNQYQAEGQQYYQRAHNLGESVDAVFSAFKNLTNKQKAESIAKAKKEYDAKKPVDKLKFQLGIYEKVGKGVVHLAAMIPGFAAREAVSAGLSAREASGEQPMSIGSRSKTVRYFIGDDPIESWQVRTSQSKNTLKNMGASDHTANILAPLGVGLATLLNVSVLPSGAFIGARQAVKNSLKKAIVKDIIEQAPQLEAKVIEKKLDAGVEKVMSASKENKLAATDEAIADFLPEIEQAKPKLDFSTVAPQGAVRSAEGETAQVGTQAVKTAETAVQEPTAAASKLAEEARKYKSADEFAQKIPQATRKLFREEGIKGTEQLKKFWDNSIEKKVEVLDNLNPTGGVYVDYNPQKRMEMSLGKNITTLNKTMGGEADDIITVYRGAPKSQKSINPGDFITTNRELAQSYTGDGNVLELKVKKSDVLDDITEPLGEEYIYRPQQTIKETVEKAPTTPKLKSETDSIGNKIEKNEAGDVVRITGKDGAVKYEATDLLKQPAKEAVAKTPKKIPQANTETPVGKQVSDIYKNTEKGAAVSMDLENAQAGKRVFNDGEVTGIKSTFPEWLPEQSRTTPIVNSVLKHLDEGTVPKESAVRVHAAYKAAVEKITGKPLSEFKPKQMVSEADSLAASAPTKTADELAPKPVNPETAKPAKAASDINKSLVAKGFEALPEDEVAKFSSIKKKETLDNVATYIENDLEAAKLAAAGKIDVPNNVHPQVLFNSIAKHAEDVNDYQLLADLAKSPIARARSEAAQTLGASGFNKDANNAVDAMQSIIKTREKMAEKRLGKGKSIAKEKAAVKKELKKEIKKTAPKAKDWKSFVESLKC